jgi:hypothetical protein
MLMGGGHYLSSPAAAPRYIVSVRTAQRTQPPISLSFLLRMNVTWIDLDALASFSALRYIKTTCISPKKKMSGISGYTWRGDLTGTNAFS